MMRMQSLQQALSGLSPLLCLVTPLWTSAFLLSGPHGALSALLWIMPLWASVLLDFYGPGLGGRAAQAFPVWGYSLLLYSVALLQAANLGSLLFFAGRLQWHDGAAVFASLVDLFAVKVIMGTSSSFGGILAAHELIHRRRKYDRLLGRLLLALNGYEHFYTEHLRGHHRRAGSSDDPATAALGETYQHFWRRSVVQQFRNAWQLENRRLRRRPKPLRLLQHRVAQGLAFEALLLAGITAGFGIAALAAYLLQAGAAIHKLQAVNYIEHWGLAYSRSAVPTPIAWDCDSWFTRHNLLGLSCHSDHHRHPAKPYHQLHTYGSSPKWPYGYFCMVFIAVFMNNRFQQLARRELRRLGLV